MCDFSGEIKAAKRKCCVLDCDSKHGSFFRFPNPKKDPERLETWIKNINNPGVLAMPRDKLYNSCFVCTKHFLSEFIHFGNGRPIKTWNAVPTLFIPSQGEDSGKPTPPKQRKLEQSITSSKTSESSHKPEVQTQSLVEERYGPVFNQLQGSVNLMPRSISSPISVSSDASDELSMEICHTPERVSDSVKERSELLKQVNATRWASLTPKAKCLYRKVVESSNRIAQRNAKLKNVKSRLIAAEAMANSAAFQNLVNHVNNSTYNFIISQVRTQKQKSKAPRFTLDDKLFALSLLKSSGKGYRLLTKLFTLPSETTLSNLLNRIPFPPGISDAVFESLQKRVMKMKKNDRVAILVFDEMPIDRLIQYNCKNDYIIGLHDEGDGTRKPEIADYAHVFLLKGVFKQWKQPLCYTFSQGPTKSVSIKNLLKKIISKCHELGFTVVATVCDQGGPNQDAIKQLLEATDEHCKKKQAENKYFGFLIDGKEIIPLYDTPHLFKGIRNSLLNKNLHFKIKNKWRVAKWLHIEQLYLLDMEGEERLCIKLTDQHILRRKINKMKVLCCTQVFSNQVGVLMKKIISWNCQVNLDSDAADTAEFILFMDKLFDSLNSSRKSIPPGKPYKAVVSEESDHINFWYDAINILSSMKFYCQKKKKICIVPSLKNLIFTIRGFIYLSQKLLKEFKNKFIALRPFQQDALDNFLGCIRNYNGRQNVPSANHFVTSFKSLITNNCMSVHSPGANCEEDESEGALDNLRGFICGEVVESVAPLNLKVLEISEIPLSIIAHKKARVSRCVLMYISGFIAKKLIKKLKCENCKENCLQHSGNDIELIDARQYKSYLIKAGSFFNFLTSESISRLFYLIPRLCHYPHLSVLLEELIFNQLNFNIINCPQHTNTSKLLVAIIVRCSILFWCKRVNLVAKGKDDKFIRFLKRKTVNSSFDPVY